MVNPWLHLKNYSQWLWSVNIVPASATSAVLLGCCIGVSKNSVLNRARQGLTAFRADIFQFVRHRKPQWKSQRAASWSPTRRKDAKSKWPGKKSLCFVPFLVPLSHHCPCILGMVYRATLKDECRDEEGLCPLKLPPFIWKRQEKDPKWTKAKQPVVRKAPVWIRQLGPVFKVFNLHFSQIVHILLQETHSLYCSFPAWGTFASMMSAWEWSLGFLLYCVHSGAGSV